MNTLKYYESLIESGNSEQEAKAHAYALYNELENLATKEDLRLMLSQLKDTVDYKFNVIEKFGGSFLIAIFVLLLKVAIWG